MLNNTSPSTASLSFHSIDPSLPFFPAPNRLLDMPPSPRPPASPPWGRSAPAGSLRVRHGSASVSVIYPPHSALSNGSRVGCSVGYMITTPANIVCLIGTHVITNHVCAFVRPSASLPILRSACRLGSAPGRRSVLRAGGRASPFSTPNPLVYGESATYFILSLFNKIRRAYG